MNIPAPVVIVSMALLSLLLQSTGAQAPAFRAAADTLPLGVSVHDPKGRFVPGLERDDFIVTVNGQPADVAVFDAELRPLTRWGCSAAGPATAGHRTLCGPHRTEQANIGDAIEDLNE